MSQKLTNEEFVKRLHDKTEKIKPLEPYTDMYTNMNFECDVGHVFSMTPHNMFKYASCPVCSGHRVLAGYNDLWTLRPDIAMLLKDENEGYIYSVSSHHKTDFICPDCGRVNEQKTIAKVTTRGFRCQFCGDGISYPNKVLRYILHKYAENPKFEWQPEWLKPYKFDGYFTKDGVEYVVEMDGGLGHGNKTYLQSEQTADETKKVDLLKDSLAANMGIHVIRIDCFYPDVSTRADFIKDNVLHSKLKTIFNLCSMNWDECFVFAESSFMKKACELYDIGEKIKDIAQRFDVHISTVRVWLKDGVKLGICSYTKDDAYKRSRKNMQKPQAKAVYQYTEDGLLVAEYPSGGEAHKQTGINNIFACIHGRQHTAGGYLWRQQLITSTN